MSKMNTPKMDVVRFKEADVVVASGAAVPQSMTVTGWKDGTKGNMIMNYGGQEFGYSNKSDLISLLTQNGQTQNVRTTTGGDYTINTLFNYENKTDNYSHTLTGLTWDATNSRWNSHQ